MSGYSVGWGVPRMNCDVCGGRVFDASCHRHNAVTRGVQVLRDKYLPGFHVLRFFTSQGA